MQFTASKSFVLLCMYQVNNVAHIAHATWPEFGSVCGFLTLSVVGHRD